MKSCSQCGVTKSCGDFHREKTGRLHAWCKPCSSRNRREKRAALKADPERLRKEKDRQRVYGRVYFVANRKRVYQKDKRWRRANPKKYLLQLARARARRLGLPCTIQPEDFVFPEHCPIFGVPLTIGEGRLADDSPTLDRLSPQAGYVPGNVLVISYKANRIKNNGTQDEMRGLANFYEAPRNIEDNHPEREAIRARLWQRRRRAAKDQGVAFDIMREDLQVPKCCPALGLTLTPNRKAGPWSRSPTVDRIDNSAGYVKGNVVVVVSSKANRMKSNGTLAELKQVLAWMEVSSV